LFYGGGTAVLKAQAVGSLIVVVATFSVSLIVMNLIKAIGLLRVSAKGESFGLDLYEHGLPAYPEYVLSHEAMPAGMLAQEETSEAPNAAPQIDVTTPEPASSIL
jgi:Amt family ammonium transporter